MTRVARLLVAVTIATSVIVAAPATSRAATPSPPPAPAAVSATPAPATATPVGTATPIALNPAAPSPGAATSSTPSPGTPSPGTPSPAQSESVLDQIETRVERAVGGAASSAAGAAGVDCTQLPQWESPLGSLADQIDPGPGVALDSDYGRYGYAGRSQIVYDPGCSDAMLKALQGVLPGQSGAALGYLRQDGGTTRAADWLMSLSLVLVAALVFLTRTAFGQGQFWQAADAMAASLQGLLGARVYVTLVMFTFVAAGLWFLRQERLAAGRLATYIARFAAIVAAGFLAAAVHLAAGSAIDSAYRGGASWLMGVAVGAPQEVPDAGSAVGTMLIDGVVAPAWEMQQLGYDEGVLAAYGSRLHAARTLTRDEAAATVADRDAYAQLIARKEADTRAIADEIARTNPAAYERLAKGNDDRLLLGVLVFVVVLLLFAVGGTMIVVLAAVRMAWRVVIAAAPAASVFLAYPRLQPVALWLKDALVAWTVAAAAATLVFVAYVRAASSAVVPSPGASLWTSFFALALLTGVLAYAWRQRGAIAARLALDREHDRAAALAAGAAARLRQGAVSVTARARAPRGSEHDAAVPGVPARLPEPAGPPAEVPAGPPVRVARSVEPRRTDAADAARAARLEEDRARARARRAAASLTSSSPRHTSPRPDETTRASLRGLQIREAEELAIRNARRTLAAKPVVAGATTAAVRAMPATRPVLAALTVAKVLK